MAAKRMGVRLWLREHDYASCRTRTGVLVDGRRVQVLKHLKTTLADTRVEAYLRPVALASLGMHSAARPVNVEEQSDATHVRDVRADDVQRQRWAHGSWAIERHRLVHRTQCTTDHALERLVVYARRVSDAVGDARNR